MGVFNAQTGEVLAQANVTSNNRLYFNQHGAVQLADNAFACLERSATAQAVFRQLTEEAYNKRYFAHRLQDGSVAQLHKDNMLTVSDGRRIILRDLVDRHPCHRTHGSALQVLPDDRLVCFRLGGCNVYPTASYLKLLEQRKAKKSPTGDAEKSKGQKVKK